MVAIPQTFNTADLHDTAGVVHIPDGQYQAVIVASDLKETNNKEGHYLAFTVVITQGQYANTEFVERLNIVNKNQTAVDIAYKTLARMSEAVGMTTTPSDSNALHNKPFLIDVATEKGKPYTDKNSGVEREGKDKSVIKKYHPLTKVGVSGAPAFGAPPAVAATPAAASPPWKK